MAQRAAKLVSGADMFREVLSSAGCISTGIPRLSVGFFNEISYPS